MKKVIKIEGMSCGHCVNHVKNALEDIQGVSNVDVKLDAKTATVNTDASVSDEAIRAAIDDAGYEVVSIVEE